VRKSRISQPFSRAIRRNCASGFTATGCPTRLSIGTSFAESEYAAHRHFGFLARHLNGPGPRFASLCQSIDELRHNQTEKHAISMYNKYYDGLHDADRMHDRVWYLSVPKSYFDDGISAGPFEFMTAISFSFEAQRRLAAAASYHRGHRGHRDRTSFPLCPLCPPWQRATPRGPPCPFRAGIIAR